MSELQHPMAVTRERLDDALVELRAVKDPEVDVAAVARHLSDAIAEAYRCLAAFSDYAAWSERSTRVRERVSSALETLQKKPSQDPAVDEATLLIASALRLLGAPSPLPVAPVLDLPFTPQGITVTATLSAPRLIALDRGVVRPSIPLPPRDSDAPGEEPETPTVPSLGELMAQARAALEAIEADDDEADEKQGTEESEAKPPPDAHAILFGEAAPYDDVLFDRARNCLEDLAAFGAMRRPTPDESWWCPRVEERLLARLDALIACGVGALPTLVKLVEERPLPDGELTWALVFLFGSIAGDDALHEVERVLRSTDLHAPGMVASVADALSHAPHPGVVPWMFSWLHDVDAAKREVAVTTLSRRSALSWSDHEARLVDEDPDVRRAAARALWRSAVRPPREVFERLLRDDDDAVVRAALRASVLHRDDTGLRIVTAEIAGTPRGALDAAMTVALSHPAEGFGLLLHAAQTDPTESEVEALGWFGHLGAARILLALLEHDDKTVAKAAANALWRLTGAPLTDDAPAPEYSDERPPWRHSFTAPERVAKLTLDPAHWTAWWNAHGHRADLSKRWRFGHPWTLEDDLWELADHDTSAVSRSRCHFELAARLGRSIDFDPDGFIVTQEAAIAALRADLSSRPAWRSSGAWLAALYEGTAQP